MESTIDLQLPDGAMIQVRRGATALEATETIGKGLAKAAIAVRLNGELVDMAHPISAGGTFEVLTKKSGDEALEILRHSTSHLLAQAVKQLWPDAQVAIGPAIAAGFYYDFLKDNPFTEEDLPRIEERMVELIKQDLPIERLEMPKAEAIRFFEEAGENFKAELVREKVDTSAASVYRQGDFSDLCRGPHLPSTGRIKAFKLMSVAGAYWKGDENNVQLQRIYGTCFFNKQDLNEHLEKIEEAKRRDHRRLGKDLDLFSFQEEVGGGLVFWHPKGALIRHLVEEYLKAELLAKDYHLVYTPHIALAQLWEKTGHLDYYKENMYLMEVDGSTYVVKPMNCPYHILIYKDKRRSYRELPIRYAEFGTVYRKERAGTLHGLMRVRGFTQDDAHLFCTPDQVIDEVHKLLDFSFSIFRDFGFEEFELHLSVRDPLNKEKYAGNDEDWIMAEEALAGALKARNIDYIRDEGEAVFYGPKIDIKLTDAIGRGWQATTIQFDFTLPERLNVCYIGEDGKEHKVVMIHRALFGSVERFMGILIEHYAGAFPLWLAPTQAVVIPITDAHHEYAKNVCKQLKEKGIRAKADLRNEKVGYKIREHQLQKVPYMLVCGNKEIEDGTISVRNRFDGDLGASEISNLIEKIRASVAAKAVRP